MKNSNFVDPNVDVSRRGMLTILKKQLTPESMTWLASLMNETVFSPDEAGQFEEFIMKCCYPHLNVADYQGNSKKLDICKPMLLFGTMFFSGFGDSDYFPCFYRKSEKEIFCTDRINTERIKCFPLLFTKVNNQDTFYPWVGKIIKAIKKFCTQNEEFAQAYKTKLGEIWNAYGSLRERLVLYVNSDVNLIREIEQPSLEISREYLIDSDNYLLTNSFFHEDLLVALLFVSLLQVDGRIQIPCWNEEDYFCRLLLDFGIRNRNIGIVDALFRNHRASDTFKIMCAHMGWRSNNMPRFQGKYSRNLYSKHISEQEITEKLKKLISHRREFVEYLKNHIPLLFSCSIPRQYRNSLYAYFFTSYYNSSSLTDEKFDYVDHVQKNAPKFLHYYLKSKLEVAINKRNHDLILDIYNLFQNENKYRFKNIDLLDKDRFNLLEKFSSLIPLLIKFWENDDEINSWDILKVSQYDADLLQILLIMKNTREMNCPPPSIEDVVLKYSSLDVFIKTLSFSPFLEQNEEMYQNMLKKYPYLCREDALLERLLPCFTAIAIRNINKIPPLPVENNIYKWNYLMEDIRIISEPWRDLILCVLDKLCGMHETEPDIIVSIFEIVFKLRNDDYSMVIAFDIFKKYHQFQELLLEYCYKTISSSWNTSINLANIYAAASIIETYKGVEHVLKYLLIVLRKTRKVWVNSDLQTDDNYLQKGDRNIVQEIEYHYARLSPESSKKLRQDMVNYLSDWLKPLPKSKRADLNKRLERYTIDEKNREGFDIIYTEPDPIWRYAYVRAIADLGIDVDGKGHYIHTMMDMITQNDPSAMVREAAKKTSFELKNLRNGRDGDNHTKNILLAFWWIKQASRLAINLPVNRENALRMRNDVSQGYDETYPEKSVNVSEQTEEKSKNKYKQTKEKLMRERLGI